MPRYRDKVTGEIIYVPDAPQAIPIGMQDPTQDLKRGAAEANITNTQANTQRTITSIQNERERLAMAKQAAASAAQAQQTAAGISNRERASKTAPLDAMTNQIARVRELYRQGPGRTKGVLEGWQDYLPTDANKAFDTAGRGLGSLGMQAFRVPGVGSQSDAELRDFIETNRPSSADRDVSIEEKIRNLETRLRESYKAQGGQYRPPTPRAPPRKPSGGGWKVERID